METIQLQSIGTVKAVKAETLKAGDVTVWNFGNKEKVLEVLKVTAKTILISIEAQSGGVYERRLNKTRLVGIA